MKCCRVLLCLLVLMIAGFWLGKRHVKEEARSSAGTSHAGEAEDPEVALNGDNPVAKASKRPRPVPEASASEFIRAKLKSIVVPVIAFDDASVEEAFDFLRSRSIALDPDPDLNRKGVSFVLRLPDSMGQAGTAPPEDALELRRLVDIEARNISLWDALHLTAREANLKVEVTDQGVELQRR